MKENKDLANGDNKKEGGGYEAEFEKYLSGELEIEQLRSIESDIEKFRVLLNYMDQELDQELYERDTEAGGGEEEAGTEEAEPGRQISKAVSRKFRKYMIAAVVAAICIVVSPRCLTLSIMIRTSQWRSWTRRMSLSSL